MANSGQSHVMKWAFRGLVAAMLVLVLPIATGIARETYLQLAHRLVEASQPDATFRSDLETYLATAITRYRKENGRSGLALTSANRLGARAHAMDMAQGAFVSHVASTGQGFDSRMRALHDGAMFLPNMGENAARDRSSGEANQSRAQKIIVQWINSASHRQLMSSKSFTQVSIGVVQKGNHLYAVAIFSGPAVKTNAKRAGKTVSGFY